MKSSTILLNNETEARMAIGLALTAGWKEYTPSGLECAIEGWKKFNWMVLKSNRTFGWTGAPYDYGVIRSFSELVGVLSRKSVTEVFNLKPTRGDYPEAIINYEDKSVDVGCCRYPFYRILELAEAIQVGVVAR